MKKPNREQMMKALDELQSIVNEMQEIMALLENENNKLSVTNALQEGRINDLIKEKFEMSELYMAERGEARGYLEMLVAERNKTWWDKLWD